MKLFFLLFLVLFSSNGQSNDKKELNIIGQNIIIGVERLEYLPYYTYEKNQYKGYARELFDRFAIDNGHNVQYKILPVARLFQEFIHNRIDFKFPDNPKWRKKAKENYAVHYSKPVIAFTDGILVKRDRQRNELSSINKIGTMRGFTPWILQDEIKAEQLKVIENNTLSGLLLQVQLKRTDACFVNTSVANFFINNHPEHSLSLIFNPALPYVESHYFLSTIKHKPLLNQFNQWLIANEDFHQRIKSKWGL